MQRYKKGLKKENFFGEIYKEGKITRRKLRREKLFKLYG